MIDWKPIETAPKDNSSPLLLAIAGESTSVGFWHDGSKCYGHRGGEGWFEWCDADNLLCASNYKATHWDSLPEPPKK